MRSAGPLDYFGRGRERQTAWREMSSRKPAASAARPFHWIPNQSQGGSVPLLPLKAAFASSQARAGEKAAAVGWKRAPRAALRGDAPLARKAPLRRVRTPPRGRRRIGFQLPETAFFCLEACSWLPKWQS